jgi:hypothetical protein
MSRLVDPKPRGARFSSGADGSSVKDYLERVAKYVPSEIVAGYVTINGVIPGAPTGAQKYLIVGNFFLCWILTPIYLCRMAKPGQPKAMHLTLSTIAFLIWSYAVVGNMGIFSPACLNWYNVAIATIFLVVFTLISGAFVPTEPPPPPQQTAPAVSASEKPKS